jgi:hypothetical protein
MTDEPEPTGSKQALTQFKPGQSGNPKGRAKGSRNKLAEAFVSDLYNDWQEHGVAAIATVRAERPHEYVKVVASILPKEVKIERMDDMNDDDLAKRVRQLAADLGVAVQFLEGIGGAADGAEAEIKPH